MALAAEAGRPSNQLHQLGDILVRRVVVVIFMLVARPVTVFLCALPDRRAKWSSNDLLFMCWTRETGVIPAALAGLLLGMNAPGAEVIASITFIAILMRRSKGAVRSPRRHGRAAS